MPGSNRFRRELAGSHPYSTGRPTPSWGEAVVDAAASARSGSGARIHVEHGTDRISRYALDPHLYRCLIFVSPNDRRHGVVWDGYHHRDDTADRAAITRRRQSRDGK